ncbi:MAG: primosomal protein N' [Gammaproteobacteria bacterium]|nr:primosomal protein N' [Gammaproteobacteria bacterium]
MKKIAQVAIIKPLHNLFDYEIPEEFGNIKPGMRVSVEFGRKLVLGFVVKVKKHDNSLDYKLKKISEVVDKKPSLDEETLNLLIWVSNYYHAPLGQVIGLGTPLYLRQGKELPNDISNDIKQEGSFLKDKIHTTKEQKKAIEIIGKSINSFECFLLDGITGSGKTEVYKNIQNQVYKNNLQTLIIVPEKNLIPELLKYFDGSDMAVLEYHSSLTPKQKFTNWNLIQESKIDIIIGTRSSVFLKIPKLGLIVVDEEHDVSFKNGSETKYNARDIAIYRAKKKNIPIILGSATPSSETILNIKLKKYTHIKMRNRVNNKTLPSLKVVNMSNKKNIILSEEVVSAIKDRVSKKEQTLIFLNRRGYSPVISCRECAWVPQCSECNLNMTFHKNKRLLMCHHCAKNINYVEKCPKCGSQDIVFLGEGTEKIEEVIKLEFTKANIVRIDSDNTRKKGQAEKIFDEIRNNKYDILVGTQMLSKGHNFPNITLVVIMNIDQSLFSPRLKAIEQLAQQLIQVSGRSGRGNIPGEVILQTSFPDNEDLDCLIKNGYETWMDNLLSLRSSLGLPPHRNWGVIQAKAKKYMDAENFLDNLKYIINKNKDIEIFGPMPSIMQKKANLYNLNLIIQAKNKSKLNFVIKDCIPHIKNIPYSNKIKWSVDIDPIDYD